jgi:hypothetical protein
MSELQIASLPPVEAATLRELQSRMPASVDELEMLVALRTKAAGAQLAPVPGTPEHTLAAWQRYLASPRPKKLGFPQWMAGHPSRMANSLAGPAAELRYRAALADVGTIGTSQVLKTPSGQPRQGDVVIEGGPGEGRSILQIKAGSESLTTTPRASGGASLGTSSLSNADSLVADAELIKAGDHVTWVFEKPPSGPLVARARELGVDVIIRVPDAASRTKMIELMRRAKMPQTAIDSVTFVEGSVEDVVTYVARRFGAS